MLPLFPNFKKLELNDEKEVDKLTYKYRHYSDHQFSSLWAWNLDNSAMICVLNNNLVVRMRDYLTGEHFYSFCGEFAPVETAKSLLSLPDNMGVSAIIRYIPEEIAKELSKSKELQAIVDRDNFDYLFSLKDALAANDKKSRRKYLKQFQSRYEPVIRAMDMSLESDRKLIVDSALKWTMEKDANPDQLENEIPAMKRLVSDMPKRVTVTGMFHEGSLIGFSIEELMDDKFAVGHFQRIDYSYRRAFIYLNQAVNKLLDERGIESVNIQQDAGDLKLRDKKLEKFPFASFKKKYNIRLT